MVRTNNYKYLIYALLFFLCIPDNSKYPALFHYTLDAVQLFSYAVAAVLFFYGEYYNKKPIQPLFIWFGWMICATLLNHTDIVSLLKVLAPLLTCAVFTFYLFDIDRDNVFRIIAWMLAILIAVQAFSFMTHCFGTVFQQGKYRDVYFFGIRVRFNRIVPVAAFMGLIAAKYGRIRTALPLLLSSALGLYFVIGESVSTSLMGYMVILMVMIGTYYIKNERLWKSITVFIMAIAVLFAFFYSGTSHVLQWLFVDFLDETTDISGRTELWRQALSYMKGVHWIVGNGYGHEYTFHLGTRFVVNVAHNQYLGTIFNFGFVGLALYIYMCVKQFSWFSMSKYNYTSRCLLATFIAIILMQIPASIWDRPYYYIFYVTSFYLPTISEEAEEYVTDANDNPLLKAIIK